MAFLDWIYVVKIGEEKELILSTCPFIPPLLPLTQKYKIYVEQMRKLRGPPQIQQFINLDGMLMSNDQSSSCYLSAAAVVLAGCHLETWLSRNCQRPRWSIWWFQVITSDIANKLNWSTYTWTFLILQFINTVYLWGENGLSKRGISCALGIISRLSIRTSSSSIT